MNKKVTDTFYWDFDKQERVRVLYRLQLVMHQANTNNGEEGDPCK